ncbi:MAG: P1 family peptidase [Candidatus Palauibacterales bacterium]|nr:P1 family peptidase [Candidatus Palauibacterales bacterium]MDP2529566.1 P1 family peptidase [Candidatus Palauibacterales bacterium]MDP2584717.1 P1 family peptidase [Candidatus Palauibacterales bacterium]
MSRFDRGGRLPGASLSLVRILPAVAGALLALSLSLAVRPAPVAAQAAPRARDLGIPFEGTPGHFDAITDVPGVEVGEKTVIEGSGQLVVGKGPARTGVTAVFPLGKEATDGVAAGMFTLNGDGEMTGSHYVNEFGELYGPVMITNTVSVGTVSAATIEWDRRHIHLPPALYARVLPVVAETWDGFLNDIYGQHVTPSDVFAALDSAHGGPVAEGDVGGGTGMNCYNFKCGTGTASRIVQTEHGQYTVGVLVQANYGSRDELRVAGVPVGREITDLTPQRGEDARKRQQGGHSIIVVVATDAPLIPKQCERLARRVSLGLGRNGSISENGSGDMFIAFSTANHVRHWGSDIKHLGMVTDITPIFRGVVDATEEAVINALVAGKTMVGRDGNTVYNIPHDRLRAILKKYGRLNER